MQCSGLAARRWAAQHLARTALVLAIYVRFMLAVFITLL
jgi:hypothetical protein